MDIELQFASNVYTKSLLFVVDVVLHKIFQEEKNEKWVQLATTYCTNSYVHVEANLLG